MEGDDATCRRRVPDDRMTAWHRAGIAGSAVLALLVGVAAIHASGVAGRVSHWWSCNPTSSAVAPVWSPNGREIALAKPAACGTPIYLVRLADASRHLLAPGAGDGWPDWSPDGRTVLFHNSAGWYTVASTGGTPRLVHADDVDTGGVFSPDGSRIAFATGRLPTAGGDYQAGLYVMNADGTDIRPVIGRSCEPGTPSWSRASPDLLAVGCSDGIYVVDAATGTARRVAAVAYGFNPEKPAWSPDGTRIAFTVDGNGVWLVKADGTHRRLIAPAEGLTWGDDATWSPDGSRIAYSESTGSNPGLYIVPVRGGRTVQITRF